MTTATHAEFNVSHSAQDRHEPKSVVKEEHLALLQCVAEKKCVNKGNKPKTRLVPHRGRPHEQLHASRHTSAPQQARANTTAPRHARPVARLCQIHIQAQWVHNTPVP